MLYGIGGLAGIGITQTATAFPPILDTDRNADWIDGGRVMDANAFDWSNPTSPSLLRPGLILGKITATGKYTNAILGVTTAIAASGATSVTVSAAQAAAIVQRYGTSGNLSFVGPPAAGGTVAVSTSVAYTAVNTTTGVVTTSALPAAYVTGSLVVGTDGSGSPLGLLGGPEYGLPMIEQGTGTRRDNQIARLLVAGQIISPNVPGLLSGDASTILWLKTQLNASGRRFLWTDEY